MAEIKPFQAWRYHESHSRDIDELTSPLFDVVSPEQLQELYGNPLNSIHISVPKEGSDPAESLREWKRNRVIEQDPIPGIYVYYQYFRLPGMERELCRKGFICLTRIYDWNLPDSQLLRHENTLSWAVEERKQLLDQLDLQASPTLGLYEDPDFQLEEYMDKSMEHPVYETEDYQGVRDVMSIIHDREVILKFMQVLENKRIILADGHHRYESAIILSNQRGQYNPAHTGHEPYNYHMMYLTNFSSGDFRVLPTHRLVTDMEMDAAEFLSRLQAYFTVKAVSNPWDMNEIISGKKWTFGVIMEDQAYRISLPEENIKELKWPFPEEIKKLDLTVLHYFVLQKVLGIAGKDQRNSRRVEFDRNFADCLYKVSKKQADLALIVNDISLKDILAVGESGNTMPQKSTYFYPKAICGFTFYSLRSDETDEELDTCFRLSP